MADSSELRLFALLFLAFLLGTVSVFSQTVKVGVLAGGQAISPLVNDHAVSSIVNNSPAEVQMKRFTLGPTVDIGLQRHLSLEVSALWKDLSNSRTVVYTVDKYTGASYAQRDTAGKAWEIPTLLKWSMPVRPELPGPFFAAGITYRRMRGRTHVYGTDLGTSLVPTPRPFDFIEPIHVNTVGPIAALGIEVLSGRSFNVVPQVRYTHWVNRAADFSLKSSNNSVDILVAVTFGK
ncbi:MAG TPA: hypothetical protein VE422_40695 [Terriglobia bacterium]|nr:hypothetical protein [Terriglobia bacterium]